jgi:hypothetical protein
MRFSFGSSCEFAAWRGFVIGPACFSNGHIAGQALKRGRLVRVAQSRRGWIWIFLNRDPSDDDESRITEMEAALVELRR